MQSWRCGLMPGGSSPLAFRARSSSAWLKASPSVPANSRRLPGQPDQRDGLSRQGEGHPNAAVGGLDGSRRFQRLQAAGAFELVVLRLRGRLRRAESLPGFVGVAVAGVDAVVRDLD